MILKVLSAISAALAALTANGWGLGASIGHALFWLAVSVLAYVLATIPEVKVP